MPETWTKLSERYPAIEGRGLDNRPGIINGGAMEINTVQHFEARSADGDTFVKVPALNFPTDADGKAALVQDLRVYDKAALYNEILEWRDHQKLPDGLFNSVGTFSPTMTVNSPYLDVYNANILGLEDVFTPYTEDNIFGFSWNNDRFKVGSFPEYFKKSGDEMIPILSSEVPAETELIQAQFPTQSNQGRYQSPNSGSWTSPGSVTEVYTAMLNDGSTVTYQWYKFIDQPVFAQFNWSEEKREKLQSLIEQMHVEWNIDQSYIPEPQLGTLVSMDDNLIVTPPQGLEVGYVPIVIGQQ